MNSVAPLVRGEGPTCSTAVLVGVVGRYGSKQLYFTL